MEVKSCQVKHSLNIVNVPTNVLGIAKIAILTQIDGGSTCPNISNAQMHTHKCTKAQKNWSQTLLFQSSKSIPLLIHIKIVYHATQEAQKLK